MSRVWLITGSSRGLGRALVEAVLASGDNLVATARDPARLADLSERYGSQVLTIALDVTDETAAAAAVEAGVKRFGRIDVLVNNAGYGNVSSIEDTSLVDFRAQIEANLFGTIIMTKAVIALMRGQGAGHIIQFSSVGGRIGPAGRGAYSAAKFGVEGFSEVLAKEVAPFGIKVTVIEPGGFRTDFAGASTVLAEGRAEYAETVGATVRFQREYNGRQPGDPAKAAAVVIHIAGLDAPPLRLLLGSDAVRNVEKADAARIEADREWRAVSVSTDFEPDTEMGPMPWEKKAGSGPKNKSAADERRLVPGIVERSAGGAEVAAAVIADIGAAARIEGAVAVGAVTLPLRRPGLHSRADRRIVARLFDILRLLNIDAARGAIDRSRLVISGFVGRVDVARLVVNRAVIGVGDGRADNQAGGKADCATDERVVAAMMVPMAVAGRCLADGRKGKCSSRCRQQKSFGEPVHKHKSQSRNRTPVPFSMMTVVEIGS